MKKIAFLDRDGTINRDYSDYQWKDVSEPEFLNGALEGMKKLTLHGFEIIIITNQYIINDGIISMRDYFMFTEKFMKKTEEKGIDILHIYFCPHNDKAKCNCKKPKPGLIEQALKDYQIDMDNSLYCGDSEVDYHLSKFFKLPFYGINYVGDQKDVIHCNNLLEVCEKLGF